MAAPLFGDFDEARRAIDDIVVRNLVASMLVVPDLVKSRAPDIVKVGPEGYIHGFICVRPPCGPHSPPVVNDDGEATVTAGSAELGKLHRRVNGKLVMQAVDGTVIDADGKAREYTGDAKLRRFVVYANIKALADEAEKRGDSATAGKLRNVQRNVAAGGSLKSAFAAMNRASSKAAHRDIKAHISDTAGYAVKLTPSEELVMSKKQLLSHIKNEKTAKPVFNVKPRVPDKAKAAGVSDIYDKAMIAYEQHGQRFNTPLRATAGALPASDDDPELNDLVAAIDSEQARVHLSEPTSFFRGLAASPDLLSQLKPGAVFKDNGFVSVTTKPRFAAAFAQGRTYGIDNISGFNFSSIKADGDDNRAVVMRIHTPAGTHVALGAVNAGEVVLPRGTSFHIRSVSADGKFIDAEVVPVHTRMSETAASNDPRTAAIGDPDLKAFKKLPSISKSDLSPGEYSELYNFTFTGHRYANEFLRTGGVKNAAGTRVDENLTNTTRRAVTAVDAVIAKSPPLAKPVTVHRNVSDAAVFGAPGSRVGRTFTEKGYTIASGDKRVVNEKFGAVSGEDTGEVTHVAITVPAGVRVVKPGALSSVKGDTEVILPRGSTFKITGDVVKDGKRTVSVELVPHASSGALSRSARH